MLDMSLGFNPGGTTTPRGKSLWVFVFIVFQRFTEGGKMGDLSAL